MLNFNPSAAVSSGNNVTRAYRYNAQATKTQGDSFQASYDSASFSAALKGEEAVRANMVGRLTQEVRASTTTGTVQELRRAVAADEYVPNPMAIAGKILFMSEG